MAEVGDDGRSHLYLIEWNQFTLDNMPPIFRQRCERDGVHQDRCWLGEKDLEPDAGDRLSLEQPTRIVTRPLRPTDQDDRIRAIFGLTSNDPLPDSSYENVCHYHAYLAAKLAFPFEAACGEPAGQFGSRPQRNVCVLGLVDLECYCSDGVGLLFQIRRDEEQPDVVQARVRSPSDWFGFLSSLFGFSAAQPAVDEGDFVRLDDLELSRKNANRQLLQDFSYWFFNH